jgi:large subunit ribosomal protein L13
MENTEIKKEIYTIDAKGKRLGRIATDIAHHLMGKHRTDVVKHQILPISVEVHNASQMLIGEKKRMQKIYLRYSGYPGGQKSMTLAHLLREKGYGEALKKAVYGMLPNNRLRAPRMKELIIKE